MKPRKKPVKLPSSLIASRKVRKVMPPPMKVHKGELRKLDDISTRILGDPHTFSLTPWCEPHTCCVYPGTPEKL